MENLYNFKEEKEVDNSMAEVMTELELIGQRVGGDLEMEIKLGSPGEGSFFNTEDVTITLDPEHVKERA